MLWEKRHAVIRADAGVVTIEKPIPIGSAPNFDIGDGTLLTTFSIVTGASPNQWRVGIAGAGGDAVIFTKWSVVSLG
jgi:hypothetical protein